MPSNTFEHLEKSKERNEMPPFYFIYTFAAENSNINFSI
jgi:hypothetical protein